MSLEKNPAVQFFPTKKLSIWLCMSYEHVYVFAYKIYKMEWPKVSILTISLDFRSFNRFCTEKFLTKLNDAKFVNITNSDKVYSLNKLYSFSNRIGKKNEG